MARGEGVGGGSGQEMAKRGVRWFPRGGSLVSWTPLSAGKTRTEWVRVGGVGGAGKMVGRLTGDGACGLSEGG